MSDEQQLIPVPGEDDEVELEIPALTAPVLPVETTFDNAAMLYQRTIGGGMLLKMLPLVATAQGTMPTPHAYVAKFSPEGWERFKREVAADGVKAPAVETARTIPGGLLRANGDTA